MIEDDPANVTGFQFNTERTRAFSNMIIRHGRAAATPEDEKACLDERRSSEETLVAHRYKGLRTMSFIKRDGELWRMHDFITVFPDPEILLALQPEELGAKMLFLLRSRRLNQRVDSFHLANLCQELWPASYQGQQSRYPVENRREINLAVAEAWGWLEAQGLLVSVPDLNGSNGWRCLSRRAQKFEDETEFVKFAIARLLPRAILHPRIVTTVWLAFMRGEFDVAVFQAMKTVEVAVREASGLSDGSYGVALMREGFDMKSGPLTIRK